MANTAETHFPDETTPQGVESSNMANTAETNFPDGTTPKGVESSNVAAPTGVTEPLPFTAADAALGNTMDPADGNTMGPAGAANTTDPADGNTMGPAGATNTRDQLDELTAAFDHLGDQDAAASCVPLESGPRTMLSKPLSMSTPALGSYADLKAKTHFAGATQDGVLKRTTYLTAVSTFRTGPKYSLGIKTGSGFVRVSSNPAPGTYSTPNEDKTKYQKPAAYSFGGVSRFGMGGEAPSKKMPGPGAYTPNDPALACAQKIGFGTSVRGKGSLVAQANPGPGAYEMRSTVGQGPMCTAGGRHPASYMRARSLPGPGSYNPATHYAYPTLPRCGFGTSTRDDIAGRARNLVMPGPGTYEMQNNRTVGSDAPKFSATSRRRVHDLNSYVTPGPGTYNAHATSFGY